MSFKQFYEGLEDLQDAFTDVKTEIIKNARDDLDKICQEVGPDYGIKPEVLKTRFLASFGSIQGVRATALATDKKTVIGDKAEKAIQKWCAYYRVPRDRCVEVFYHGKSVTIVCRLGRGKVIGIDNTNGVAYDYSPGAVANMRLKTDKISQSPVEESADNDEEEQMAMSPTQTEGDDAESDHEALEHVVKVGDKYRLVSKKSGKNLGTYNTKAGAEKRERQVQYFKHKGK